MIQYRVTKYGPQYRDASGRFNRNEWIMYSQIGESFDEGVLTEPRYLAMESTYIDAAVSFLTESGIDSLAIVSLENASNYHCSDLAITESQLCSIREIESISRLILRQHIWCKLIWDTAFLHFGWDYYSYIGVPEACPNAIHAATKSGLFVQKFNSPHRNK